MPARAQVVLDLSLVTCQQLLASDAERQVLIGSWMSGYFSATKDLDTLDLRYVERNRQVVGNYCQTHKTETVSECQCRRIGGSAAILIQPFSASCRL